LAPSVAAIAVAVAKTFVTSQVMVEYGHAAHIGTCTNITSYLLPGIVV
jgi:hypothetical protein